MKTTQKQAAFYKLYSEYKKDPERYIPTWEFVGEMLVKPLGVWVLMSYKCPARLSDLTIENPNLLVRKSIKGKSGANYYGYKFKQNVTILDIKDPEMRVFYQLIKSKE